MTYVKSWTVTPPSRLTDDYPWQTLRIRESGSSTGPWTVIDTQAWTDLTPSSPDTVIIETTLATLDAGWYQFEWEDATTAISRSGAVYDGDSGLFTIAEARDEIGDPAYPENKIAEARSYAADELEKALGYSLLTKQATETLFAHRCKVTLRPYVQAVTAVEINGVQQPIPALIASRYFATTYQGPVTVTYTHGLGNTVSPGAKRAALALALDYLQADPAGTIDPRAESIVTVDGTLRLRSGGTFGNPLIDDWLNRNRLLQVA